MLPSARDNSRLSRRRAARADDEKMATGEQMKLESRLRRVEFELRLWRMVALSVLVVAAFLAAEGKPRELKVAKLIVGEEANGIIIDAEKGVSSIYIGRTGGTTVFIAAADDGTAEVTASGKTGDASVRSDSNAASLDLSSGKTSSLTALASPETQLIELTSPDARSFFSFVSSTRQRAKRRALDAITLKPSAETESDSEGSGAHVTNHVTIDEAEERNVS
jgi:hypothetical protein